MAMAVVYTNFAGQIVSENRGGTVREYVPDTLGSTTALATAGGITDTWDYWPYGEVMSRTGSTPTPFALVGVLGYFKDLLDKLFYVRARHYQPNYGRWLTVDPLWPVADAFVYRLPVSDVDPSSLYPFQYCVAFCAPFCVAATPTCLGCMDACQAALTLDDLRKLWDGSDYLQGRS